MQVGGRHEREVALDDVLDLVERERTGRVAPERTQVGFGTAERPHRPHPHGVVRVRAEAVERIVVIPGLLAGLGRRREAVDLPGEGLQVGLHPITRDPARQLEESTRGRFGVARQKESDAVGRDLGGPTPEVQVERGLPRHIRRPALGEGGGDRHRDAVVVEGGVAELVTDHEPQLRRREVLEQPTRDREHDGAVVFPKATRVEVALRANVDLDRVLEAEHLATLRDRIGHLGAHGAREPQRARQETPAIAVTAPVRQLADPRPRLADTPVPFELLPERTLPARLNRTHVDLHGPTPNWKAAREVCAAGQCLRWRT